MDAEDLRRQLAVVDEQLARYTLRSSTGYGTDADRGYWLDLLATLRRRRERLVRELAEVGDDARADPPG